MFNWQLCLEAERSVSYFNATCCHRCSMSPNLPLCLWDVTLNASTVGNLCTLCFFSILFARRDKSFRAFFAIRLENMWQIEAFFCHKQPLSKKIRPLRINKMWDNIQSHVAYVRNHMLFVIFFVSSGKYRLEFLRRFWLAFSVLTLCCSKLVSWENFSLFFVSLSNSYRLYSLALSLKTNQANFELAHHHHLHWWTLTTKNSIHFLTTLIPIMIVWNQALTASKVCNEEDVTSSISAGYPAARVFNGTTSVFVQKNIISALKAI